MTSFKYTLEPYRGSRTKHACPQCGKKTLTRYIDVESGEYLSDNCGRCDREVNCAYNYTPKQFYTDNGEGYVKDVSRTSPSSPSSPKVFIPLEILKKSRAGYPRNTFAMHLSTLFDDNTVNSLITSYHIGTSDGRWPGACLFWFIDINGRIHAGQVKLFKDGHTANYEANGEVKKATTFIHAILRNKLLPVPEWLDQYCQQEKKIGCLFGEHLLRLTSRPIAIVEAPATAIVASVYLPQFTWLAAGSLAYLTPQRCEVLKGRKVVLYPDLKAYDKWKSVADRLGFDCSNLLEENASVEDKAKGLDLRDYLERFSISDFVKPSAPYCETLKDGSQIWMSPKGFPLSWESDEEFKKHNWSYEAL